MPPFVHVGPGGYLPGSGNLGAVYGPLQVPDPSGKQVKLPDFGLTVDVNGIRFKDRQELLGAVDATRTAWHSNRTVEQMDVNYQRAAEILTSSKVRDASTSARRRMCSASVTAAVSSASRA